MDLAIIYSGSSFTFDLALNANGSDLAADDGLRSAVLVSLFTDRRANSDDVLPDGTDDRRGSWQDQYPDLDGDLQGSRLWLLAREKQLPDVLQRAQAYAEEALAWLLADGVARAVTVTAEWVASGMLGLLVDIRLVNGSRFTDVFNYPVEG